MSKDQGKRPTVRGPAGPRSPLELVGAKEDEGMEQGALDALNAVLRPRELSEADHEVLLAMTLGEAAAVISDDERVAAEELRRALEERGGHPLAELAGAMAVVHRALDLTAADHEALLALAVGEDAARVAEDERMAADRLVRALDDNDETHPLAALARATALAGGRGRDLDELALERVVRRTLQAPAALGRVREGLAVSPSAKSQGHAMSPWAKSQRHAMSPWAKSQRRRAVVGAIVALAAGVALFAGSTQWLETQGGGIAKKPAEAAELIEARSTQELFDPLTPFAAKGGESERLDRIVAARSADLRANRFAAWGVR